MPFYVVVYVGYEGIEHILAVATTDWEAATIARHYRAIAADPCKGKKADELICSQRLDGSRSRLRHDGQRRPRNLSMLLFSSGHRARSVSALLTGRQKANRG